MTHYSDALLRAYYRQELSETEESSARYHLNSCEDCRSRLRKIILFERLLEEYFAAREKTCPPIESIFGFVFHVLAERETLEVRDHLIGCEICSVLAKEIEMNKNNEADLSGSIILFALQSPRFIEILCRDFVKQKLPHEARWSASAWNALKSVLQDFDNTSFEEWVDKRSEFTPSSFGFISPQSADLISPIAMLILGVTLHTCRKTQSIDLASIQATVHRIASLSLTPKNIEDEIVNYLNNIFQQLRR